MMMMATFLTSAQKHQIRKHVRALYVLSHIKIIRSYGHFTAPIIIAFMVKLPV